MSSSNSISSQSSLEASDAETSTHRLHVEDRIPKRSPAIATSMNRPLPDPPRRSSSDHSDQTLSALLRDRPLPNPTEQTAEERRRSIIALDRKRRLTNPEYGDARRRSNHASIQERRLAQDSPRMDGSTSASTNRNRASSIPHPAEVIDLTGSSPPTVPTNSRTAPENRQARTSSNTSRQYLVRRWQPDSEVSECPICHRPFTWMFRRHHCRKCGRVVCNECSPHRITIPRQFIVHPPGLGLAASPSGTVDLTHEDDDDQFGSPLSPAPQMDGGEKVRLCNPCVPDPQPEPPPNYLLGHTPAGRDSVWNLGTAQGLVSHYPGAADHRHSTSHSGVFGGTVPSSANRGTLFRHQDSAPRNAQASTYGGVESRDAGGGWLGHVVGLTSPSRYRFPTSQTSTNQQPQNGPPNYLAQPGASSLAVARPTYFPPRQPRDELSNTASSMPSRSRGMSLYDDDNNSIARNDRPRPSQNPFVMSSRPRLAEIDICPICRRALPPRGPNNDESAREAHIVDCLRARDPTYQGEGVAGGPSQQRIHMLPFIATEKDCVGQDGNTQECSICMVEYDVGDELARLECLCKFHKECIVEWLGRKAECPLHKLLT